jgi:hypothetical protein
MGAPYSPDLGTRVIAAVDGGLIAPNPRLQFDKTERLTRPLVRPAHSTAPFVSRCNRAASLNGRSFFSSCQGNVD